jgi:hypothetical protein
MMGIQNDYLRKIQISASRERGNFIATEAGRVREAEFRTERGKGKEIRGGT